MFYVIKIVGGVLLVGPRHQNNGLTTPQDMRILRSKMPNDVHRTTPSKIDVGDTYTSRLDDLLRP